MFRFVKRVTPRIDARPSYPAGPLLSILFILLVSACHADTTILFPINGIVSAIHNKHNFWRAFTGGIICATAKQLSVHQPPLQCHLLNDIGASMIEGHGLRLTYGPLQYDTHTKRIEPLYYSIATTLYYYDKVGGDIDWHSTVRRGTIICTGSSVSNNYYGYAIPGAIFMCDENYTQQMLCHEYVHTLQFRQTLAFASSYIYGPLWQREMIASGLTYVYGTQWADHDDRPLEYEAAQISGTY